jgi:putative heme iron utilization protein
MADDKSNPQPDTDSDPLIQEARAVLQAADRAVLSTLSVESGHPYGSLVMLALDHDTTPLLLMSDLSQHARNLAADDRASLLIDGTAGRADPLTGPRVTLLGRIRREEDPARRARYRARYPEAFYADFADFHLYRLDLERVHFIAGFGRVRWIDAGSFLLTNTQSDPEIG